MIMYMIIEYYLFFSGVNLNNERDNSIVLLRTTNWINLKLAHCYLLEHNYV